MLVDACRDEGEGEGKNIDPITCSAHQEGHGRAVQLQVRRAAFEAERLEHGIFFHHVIKGLEGEAKNKKGRVTWASLVEHVVEKVTEDIPELIGGGAPRRRTSRCAST